MTAYPAIFYRDPIYAAMTHEAQEQRQKFSQRIGNWIRVARERRWQSAEQAVWNDVRCHSVEHRFEADRLSEEEEHERRRPSWPPDVLDAWEIEDAWRAIEHMPYRMFLAYHYHKRLKPRRICSLLKIDHTRFDETLRKARATLRNMVERRHDKSHLTTV